MSRQLAARTALGVLCPLLQLAPDAVAGGPIFPGEEAASGMLGARRVTVAELEAKEVATLRLKLTDDKILESTVGKTPVMVLQGALPQARGQGSDVHGCYRGGGGPESAAGLVRPFWAAVVHCEREHRTDLSGRHRHDQEARKAGVLEISILPRAPPASLTATFSATVALTTTVTATSPCRLRHAVTTPALPYGEARSARCATPLVPARRLVGRSRRINELAAARGTRRGRT